MSLFWLWNEPLNELQPTVKHAAWISSGFRTGTISQISAGWRREGATYFSSRRSLRPVAILEWKKWGGNCGAKEKVGGET